MQSNKNSIYESFTQTISGVVIGFLIQKFVFPHIGINFTNEQNIKAVVIFFFSSLTRQYVIRRMFDEKFFKVIKFFFRSIKEYFWATRISLRKKTVLEYFDYDYTKLFIRNVKSEIKTKYYKRVITKLIKKYRTPYKPVDFSEAKSLYLEFQKQNALKKTDQVKEGDFLYVISDEYPVKGMRFSDYYINYSAYSNEQKVVQVDDVYTNAIDGNYFISSDNNFSYINIHQCRFATPDEIAQKEEYDIEKSLIRATRHLFRHK